MRILSLTLIISLNLWINLITILQNNFQMKRHGDPSKSDLVEIVLETRNIEYIEINSQSSSNSLSSRDLSSLSDMNMDYNSSADDNSRSSDDHQTDAVQQLNRNIFIKLFKDEKNILMQIPLQY